VRFASVYRRFKDIDGFERELLDIRKRRTHKHLKTPVKT
jgi:transcriptional regulator NrdR family protein